MNSIFRFRAAVAFAAGGSEQFADVEESEDHAVDSVLQSAVRSDAKLVGLAVVTLDALAAHFDVAHDVEHPALKLRDVEPEMQMGKRLAYIAVGKSEDTLGFRRMVTDVQVFPEHNHRDGTAV